MAVSSDGTRLFVTDLGANRVLIWNSIPTANNAAADVVIGQPDMSSSTANNTSLLCASNGVVSSTDSTPTYPGRCEKSLSFPRYALSDGQRLYIADGGNDRVLIYSNIPTGNTPAADYVLGQPDFITYSPGDNADEIQTPTSLAWDGSNLYVADVLTGVFWFSRHRISVCLPRRFGTQPALKFSRLAESRSVEPSKPTIR